MPDTRTKKTVEQVRAVAGDRRKLKALKPIRIIFSNDHAEQFFHNAAPPFTIHVGGEASGEFAGRKFHEDSSEISFELVRQLYAKKFRSGLTSSRTHDYAIGIPLTHIGLTDPVLADLRQCLPAAATDDGTLLCVGPAIARTVTSLG